MSQTNADVVSVLELLRVLAIDGAAGYRHAAAEVKEPERLHDLLSRNAADREDIVTALTTAVVGLGQEPTRHGSLRGAAHRGWLSALNAFAADSHDAVHAIVHECERGERHTIEGFRRALDQLTDELRELVRAQLGRIEAAEAALRAESELLP